MSEIIELNNKTIGLEKIELIEDPYSIPAHNRGNFNAFYAEILNRFYQIKPDNSLKLSFNNPQIKQRFVIYMRNKRKELSLAELRIIARGNEVFLLKLPFNKEDDNKNNVRIQTVKRQTTRKKE